MAHPMSRFLASASRSGLVLAACSLLSAGALAAQQGPRQSSTATQPAAKRATATAKSGGRASGRRARPVRLTAKQRIEAEIAGTSQHIRSAMVVQDTATLAALWADEYTFTSLSGETYSKSDRLESIMSPTFVVDEAAEVLPSELDIVRLYGNVAVVQSRLAPPGTAKSGSRGGRAKLLSVWVRQNDGKWRTVAAQATAVDVPLPPSSKKKK